MTKRANLWRRLTDAPASVTEPTRVRQSQLLASVLLLLIPLGAVSIAVQLFFIPNFAPTFIAIAMGLFLLLLAYGLTRAGHYRSGAVMVVGVTALGSFAAVMLPPHNTFSHAFLFLSIFLASLLFSETYMLLTTAVVLFMVTLVLPASGARSPGDDPVVVPIFLICVTALLLIYRRHGNTMERDRHAELSASEERFRSLAEVALEGIVFIVDGRIIDINERGASILGAAPGAIIGRDAMDFCAPEFHELAMHHIHTNSEERYEVTGMRTGNIRFPMEVQGRRTIYQGRPVRVTVLHDLTERRRAEEDLLQIARGVSANIGDSFLHSLVAHLAKVLNADYAFVGGLMLDTSDRIRTIAVHANGERLNNFEYHLAGTPCENVVGHFPCAHPQDVQKHFPADQMLKKLNIDAYVGTPLFDSTGRALGLISVLFCQPVEQHARVASTLQIFAARAAAEIERARAEQALRTSEARYRTIVETAQEGIWQIDAYNRTTFINQTMADMLGYAMQEIRGRTVLEFMYDEDQTFALRVIERHRQGMGGQHEFKFRRKDGSELWTLCNTNPLVDEHGGYVGAFAMLSDIGARKRIELALSQSESNLRALTENANVGILVNYRGRHVFANNQLLKMLGYSMEELRTTGIKELVHPDEYNKVMARFSERIQGKPATPVYETIFLTKDGRDVPVDITATKTTWQGEPAGLVFLHDISERRRTEAQMRKLSSAVEQTADTVLITDRDGIIEYVNPAFEHTTGYARAEALGQKPRLLKSGKQSAVFYQKLWNTILAGEVFSEVFINRRKDGRFYYEEKTITPLKDANGHISHFVATGKDVTERAQAQERLQHMAQHDALTELPNRMLLLDRLKQALARARWHKRIVALLFVDLDRFKTINDTLGHETGDLLLQQLATRFSRNVREGDTVARFGGDEFVILLDEVAHANDISNVAQKILLALAPPFEIAERSLYITASIGISMCPNDGEDSSTLLKNADIAMYRAKELGKNTYQFYSADMSVRAFERLTLESNLRHALGRDELRLHYQPIMDVASGAIIGVEALLRWQHPDFGLVMPTDFIPLLEETGLIVQAGDWALAAACTQMRAWHMAGWPGLRLSVNLSPRQFQTEDLAATIKHGLEILRCPADLLELEITEGVILQHAAATLANLEALRALGVRLALDDFGTGYSSLSYLRRFPIDTLKIDRSFVHDIPGDADDSAITSAIIVLAQNLNLDVIAEGVETEAQRDFLSARGCHRMQGSLFSLPLPAEEMTCLLQASKVNSRAGTH